MARRSSRIPADAGRSAEHVPRIPRRPPRPAGTSGNTILFPGPIPNVRGRHPHRSRASPDTIADLASPVRPPKAGLRSTPELSLAFPPACERCCDRVKTPEPLFARSGSRFPTVGAVSVRVRHQPPLFEPDVIRQYVALIGIVTNSRQVRAASVFVSKQPQSPRVDTARSPKLNHR